MKFKRKRVLLSAAAAALVVLAGFLFFKAPSRKEPSYRGRTLSKWLNRLDDSEAVGISSGPVPTPTPRQIEAAEAIRAIGTNALPLLINDIKSSPQQNSPRMKFFRSINVTLADFTGWSPGFGEVTEEDHTRWRAAQGMAALATETQPENVE